jgi:hypothetical protein
MCLCVYIPLQATLLTSNGSTLPIRQSTHVISHRLIRNTSSAARLRFIDITCVCTVGGKFTVIADVGRLIKSTSAGHRCRCAGADCIDITVGTVGCDGLRIAGRATDRWRGRRTGLPGQDVDDLRERFCCGSQLNWRCCRLIWNCLDGACEAEDSEKSMS